MTFCLNGCGDGTEEPIGGYDAPSDMSASLNKTGRGNTASINVSLNWVDNSSGADNEDSFIIERCEETGNGRTKTCNFSEHATISRDITFYEEIPGSGTFKYRVKARRGAGDDTGYSNEVEI